MRRWALALEGARPAFDRRTTGAWARAGRGTLPGVRGQKSKTSGQRSEVGNGHNTPANKFAGWHARLGGLWHPWGSFWLMLVLGVTAQAWAAEAAWWNTAWPYRVKIECPAGEGDVAQATVVLADRTTDTGRDLRLVDEAGQFVPFVILHHDPKLRTLVALRVPPGEPMHAWLYFGNARAPAFETNQLPGMSAAKAQQMLSQWRKAQQQRDAGTAQQRALEGRIAQMQREAEALRKSVQAPPAALAEADRTIEQLQRQLETVQRRIAELPVPPELPEPEDLVKWQPRRGVLLSVYRKPEPASPKTLLGLNKLIKQSTLEGAGFRRGISDGCNPFGTSDNYVSVYSGWLRIDEGGEYGFCSASDEGSWIMVNGRPILDWPGPHGWQGAGRGQKNGKAILRPGVAHVEYYHEEATGPQLAFLGWKPPGQEHFSAIPEDRWLNVRQATVTGYEGRNKQLLALPEVQVVNTWWVRDSNGQQAALVQYVDQSTCARGKIRTRRWSLGDGLESWSARVQHMYFRTFRPSVELTVTDNRGHSDTVRFSPNIFKVDVQSIEFAYGNEKQYVRHASGYDVSKMERDDLAGYAEFWAHLEQWENLVRAAGSYLDRFGDSADASRVAGLAVQAFLSPGQYNPKRADEMLSRAIAGAKDPQSRRALLLQRGYVLIWHLGEPAAARALYQEVCPPEQLDKEAAPREVRRACLIGLADAALLSGEREEAAALYRRAQWLADRTASEAEALAKKGIYPYSVDDLLSRGEYDWARRTIDEWEDQLPESKMDGYSLFLRGKVLFVEHPGEQALRYLALAEQVAPKGVFVPEAAWLHANCLMAMGRHAEALVELQRIRSDFTRSEFHAQAAEKIKECEGKVPATMSVGAR